MARGFLAGAIWGLVVSGVGAGVLSVAMGPPANRTAPPEAPIATDPVAEAVDSLSERAAPVAEAPVAEAPETEEPEEAAAAPDGAPGDTLEDGSASQAPDEIAGAAADATKDMTSDMADDMAVAEPAEGPDETVVEPAPETRSENTETPPPARRPSEERGVAPSEAGPVLSAPSLAEGSAPDTNPLQRPDPIPAPDAPDAPGASEAARLAVGGDAPVQPGLPALPPEAPLAEAQPALSTDPAQPPQPAEDSGLAAAPAPAPEVASEDPEMPVAEPEASEPPRVTALIPERPAEAPGSDGPGIGRPATSLVDRASEVQEPQVEAGEPDAAPRVGTAPESRLPVITDEAPAAAPVTAEDAPLRRFAAAADLAPGEPALSIVLIDDGTGPLGPETVEAFPFPVSFAIAATHPDPVGAASGYRARGFEVLALAELPENATPSDTEVALEGALTTVPEAIGVLEGADLVLQHDRAVAEQAADILAASGHGLLLMPNGLNTAEALARRAGVPSLTVFRDFDGKGQEPRVMRRFLDQAAFKARQDENVVMLGRLRADTVSALLLWGLQDRANSVALVPVSALLLRQGAAE
ncbi:divergent polysaccharide deacetylase family protein [Alloyangia pacifica]|uniref:divergent polysaccharide deacetylase family protein n=1 Tax=Alloyangia pacifica TaxID=311180 RepID=UPI001CFD7B71|nr:divergent polysaccharide deacetylase family protein [Alloyangia pacifica]